MLKTNWTKIIAVALLILATARGHAQSGPPALPAGEIIGYWSFDDTNWLTAWNLPPRAATNLISAPDWSGSALQIDSPDPAYLIYNFVDTTETGRSVTNLSPLVGSIEFWYAPDWDSGDSPGSWGRLLEINNFSDTNYPTAFGLYFSPDGTGLYVSGRTNTLTTNYLSTSISWNAGEWHYLILTYDQTGTNTVLYLDGQVAASNNIPLALLPAGANPATNWFALGSDVTGNQQMAGSMDELYAYDYVLDAATVAEYYAQLSPFVSPLPTTRGGGSHTMADGPPTLPGGGGSGGTTNVVGPWSPTNMFSPAFRLGIAPPGTNQWNSDSNSIVIIINQTTNAAEYQLWSTTNLAAPINWKVEQTLIGSSTTSWTAFVVSMAGRGPQTFFTAINYTQDSGGEGLPDWWQIEFFGTTGVDPYADPEGDGYSNLYKFQNGMNPHVFYQPAAPVGFTSALNTNGNIVFSWTPVAGLPSGGGGALTSYVITIPATPYSPATNITVSASATNLSFNPGLESDLIFYIDEFLQFMPQVDDEDGQLYEDEPPTAGIQARFANTNSLSLAGLPLFIPALSVNAAIVRGPAGALYLAASTIPPNVTAIRVLVGPYSGNYPINAGFAADTYEQYITNPGTYPTFENLSYFDVPVASLTNGIYQIPVSRAPLFVGFSFTVMGMDINGNLGIPQYVSPNDDTGYFYNGLTLSLPFLDGRTNIAQNINILLRGADNMSPYGASVGTAPANPSVTNLNYVFAGFYFRTSSPGTAQIDEFEPFEDNNLYNFFAFNLADFDSSGDFINGVDPYYGLPPSPDQIINVDVVSSLFSAYNYGVSHTNFPMAGIPPVATTSNTGWLLAPSFFQGFTNIGGQNLYLFDYGVTSDGVHFTVPSGVRNIYGLPLNSLIYQPDNTSSNLAYPNHTYAGDPYDFNLPFYANVAQPALQTVGYYFARPRIDPMPGDANFSPTNVTPSPLIVPFGQSVTLAAFAKQAVTNGYSGVFAYPQQYFDKAFLADTNGNPTTTQTGILSEYGDFFPTQPGQVILTTKPDAATGATGQVTINVIKLQLDVNHDGTMDPTFAGPDNTSANQPFVFWLNNDYDQWHTVDVIDLEQDDLLFADCPRTPGHPAPDCNYLNISGNREISCTRDLEDFARLWTVGVTSSLLASLPTNSTITLSWGDVGSPNSANPTIDLFAAAEESGGMAYLTNGVVATNQIDFTYSPYVGRLGPGESLQLNACEFGNCWRGSLFIWCGVSNGMGNLTLTISEGTNTLAQTTAAIRLLDIKQMYERWTVGDEPAVAPLSVAYLAADGLPPGSQRFLYGPPATTNTPYILHVHGSNMELWKKDRFAETMFKRLYWQGYQGRFGSFRWPTASGFSPIFDNTASFYGGIEYRAWQSGAGLKNLLTSLNILYPGQVQLSAHSMGTVTVGEALRQATTTLVQTYTAFQGNVPAHAYDTNAPTLSLGSADVGESNVYAHYWTATNSQYFSGVVGAARYVNFFNTNDFVLNHWLDYQPDKPVTSLGYGYIASKYYEGVGTAPILMTFPTNTYEIFSFCQQAKCNCIGEQGTLGGVFSGNQVNLLVAPYSFGTEHKGHSAEFRSDNMSRAVFWDQVLVQMRLK